MQDPLTRRHSRAYLVAGVITAAAAGVLFYWTSTARPMWVDEEMLALNVRARGFGQLAGPLWLDQSAPFGWLVLERLIMVTLGTREIAVRALTILFGLATLTIAWWIGRRWMTPFGAAVFVALCGTGEWLVFFTLELKHYSADAAGALLVPALAVWALDARDGPAFNVRVVRWWMTAAGAMWFSNGALFVTPGCALVLFGAALARGNSQSPDADSSRQRWMAGVVRSEIMRSSCGTRSQIPISGTTGRSRFRQRPRVRGQSSRGLRPSSGRSSSNPSEAECLRSSGPPTFWASGPHS